MRRIDPTPEQRALIRSMCEDDVGRTRIARELELPGTTVLRTIRELKGEGLEYEFTKQSRGSVSQRGTTKPKRTPEWSARQSLLMKQYWKENPRGEEYREKLRKPKRRRSDGYVWPSESRKRFSERRRLDPPRTMPRVSSVELAVKDQLAKFGWTHQSDYKLWVRGRDGDWRVPDFHDIRGKRVLEIWGDYWHRNDDPQNLIDFYRDAEKRSYKCTIVWVSELEAFLASLEGGDAK